MSQKQILGWTRDKGAGVKQKTLAAPLVATFIISLLSLCFLSMPNCSDTSFVCWKYISLQI